LVADRKFLGDEGSDVRHGGLPKENRGDIGYERMRRRATRELRTCGKPEKRRGRPPLAGSTGCARAGQAPLRAELQNQRRIAGRCSAMSRGLTTRRDDTRRKGEMHRAGQLRLA
jgi:hypothetical protein